MIPLNLQNSSKDAFKKELLNFDDSLFQSSSIPALAIHDFTSNLSLKSGH